MSRVTYAVSVFFSTVRFTKNNKWPLDVTHDMSRCHDVTISRVTSDVSENLLDSDVQLVYCSMHLSQNTSRIIPSIDLQIDVNPTDFKKSILSALIEFKIQINSHTHRVTKSQSQSEFASNLETVLHPRSDLS